MHVTSNTMVISCFHEMQVSKISCHLLHNYRSLLIFSEDRFFKQLSIDVWDPIVKLQSQGWCYWGWGDGAAKTPFLILDIAYISCV